MLKRLEAGLATLLAAGSIAVAVADMFGLLGGIGVQIPNLTLILVGLLASYIIFERIGRLDRMAESVSKVSSDLSVISSFFEQIKSGDEFSRLKFVSAARGFAKIVQPNVISGSKDDIFQIWQESLAMSNTFQAFNRVKPEEVWGTEWSFKIAQALQGARIGAGCSIKRLFIVDDEAEFQSLVDLMRLQRKMGVNVRWVLKDRIWSSSIIAESVKDIGTDDFVAVNSDLVFRVYLDETRSMARCDLIKDERLCNKARRAMNEAWSVASEIDIAEEAAV